MILTERVHSRTWICTLSASALFAIAVLFQESEYRGSTQLHTIMEVIATLFALIIGIVALVRFYSNKNNNMYLFIGMGFLGTALLDGYHCIVTSSFFHENFPSAAPSLIPWSWNASRTFLGLLILLSWWTWRREQKLGMAGQIGDRGVQAMTIVLTLLSFCFFAFVPLPRAYYPEFFFARPQEFVAGVFFLVAFIGYSRKGDWRHDVFEFWLLMSLLVGIICQVAVMSRSFILFDSMFDMAHMLKILSYTFVLIGLLVGIFSLYSHSSEIQQESELAKEQFDLVIEESPLAMVMINQNREIILANSATSKYFGYAKEELLGELIEILLPQRYRDNHPQQVAGFFTDGQSRQLDVGRDLLGLHRDGHEFPVEIFINFVQTPQGPAAICSVIDISELKKTQKQFELVIEESPLAMLMINQNREIVLANSATSKYFGYAKEELLGELIEILLPQRYRENHPQQVAGFFTDGQSRQLDVGRDLLGLHRDGHEFPVEIFINFVQTPHAGPAAICSVVDISELKKTQKQFELVIEESPFAMLMINQNREIVLANSATSKYFGYAKEELLGELIETLLPQRYRENHPQQVAGSFTDGQSRQLDTGRDLLGLHKEGYEFPVEIFINFVQTSQGPAAICSVVDISERKKAEGEIAHQSEKLKISNRALENINLELEQFAYIASHDLQEPLRKVASCCQMLADDYADKLDADGREWIKFAVDGAARMRVLVSDLLEFSRVGALNIDSEPICTQEACNAALYNLADTIENDDVQIICRPLPMVLGNKRLLIQLFQNLISNSIKYGNDEQTVIEMGSEPDSHQWQFYVKDNGIGIAPEYHERIFQVFQRLHLKDEYSGTGIGLATCKKVVDKLGGRLWVQSQAGEGSTFYFTLPGIESIRTESMRNIGEKELGTANIKLSDAPRRDLER